MNGDTGSNFDKVIPTGWLTSYGRSFSDIPYVREIFDELERMRTGSNATLHEMKDTKLAAKFEARYKLIDRIVCDLGINQILELASGLSTRGIVMTADPVVRYVEVDLPLMMADKRKIFAELKQRETIPARPNLYFENGNVVNSKDVIRAVRHFDTGKPVVVITEGLLRYLTLEEQHKHAKVVIGILKKFGGAWITPDISLIDTTHGDAGVTIARRKKITQLTGKNVSENRFLDISQAHKFFEDLGFIVRSHSFLEVTDQLVSPKKLGLTSEYVKQINSGAVVFEMRLKEN